MSVPFSCEGEGWQALEVSVPFSCEGEGWQALGSVCTFLM